MSSAMAEEHELGQEHRLFEKVGGKVHEAEREDQDKSLEVENDAAKGLQFVDRGKTSSAGENSQSREDYQKQTRSQDTLTWSENLQLSTNSRQEKLAEGQPFMEPFQEHNYLSIEKQKVVTDDGSDSTRTDFQRQKIQASDQQCEGESKVANINNDQSQSPKWQAPMDSQVSSNCSDQPLDADNKFLESLDRSTCLHSQTDCLLSTAQTQSKIANESQSSTKYLDSVISSIQSLSDNQSETKRDNVQISRAEFVLMVEQTLKAQTMCNYMQQLVQKNQMLNKQNEIMKQTMRAWQSVGDEGQAQSLPSETQIFRFDGCPQPPVSLPPRMPNQSASCNQHLTDYCYYSQPSQVSGPQSAGHEYVTGFLQADSDPMSGSFQLPSQLDFDGDSLLSGKGGREASGTPLLPSTTSGAAAASTDTEPNFNIPNSDLLYGAHSYSGLQQHEENITGNAGVSPEQCALMEEELIKSKMFVFKICKDGGFHPDILKELVSYRNEVKILQEENRRLKTDLENVRSQASAHEENNRKLQDEIRARNNKFLQQKAIEKQLIAQIAQIGQENKELKSDLHSRRSISQLASSEGPPALPTIQVLPSRTSAECQTDVDKQDRLTQTEEQAYQLQQEAERAHSMLIAANIEISDLQHRLEERTVHCTKLDEERSMFSKQNDQLKRRCDYMESKLTEERKRWSRDEKHMVEQVKEDAKNMNRLENLVLALDTALTEGTPLQKCHVDHLTEVQKGNKSSVLRTMLTNSARSKNPLAGSMRSAANSGHLSPQNPHCTSSRSGSSSGANSACAPLYQGNNQQGYNIGLYEHNPQSGVNRGLAVPANRSITPEMQRQYASLHPGGNTVLSSQGDRPLQRNNMGGSAPAMSSTSGAGASTHRQ